MAKETQIKLTKTRYRLGAWELRFLSVCPHKLFVVTLDCSVSGVSDLAAQLDCGFLIWSGLLIGSAAPLALGATNAMAAFKNLR